MEQSTHTRLEIMDMGQGLLSGGGMRRRSVAVRGDAIMLPNVWHSIELQTTTPIPGGTENLLRADKKRKHISPRMEVATGSTDVRAGSIWSGSRGLADPDADEDGGVSSTGKSFDRSIVEGPIRGAVWKLAWPTMLQNIIGGLQGIVDHAMVGNYVGYVGNAAIGVSWQIFLVVIVFISSLFTGMGVLVARFTGANEPDKVNRTVYQAFLTAVMLVAFVLAPIGWFFSPILLELVNATAEVQAEALPYLRTMFVFSFGMLLFFMFSGALRSAGGCSDADATRDRNDTAQHWAQCHSDSGPRSNSCVWRPGGCDGHCDCGCCCVCLRARESVWWPLGRSVPPKHGVETGLEYHSRIVPVWTPDWDSRRSDERWRCAAPRIYWFTSD